VLVALSAGGVAGGAASAGFASAAGAGGGVMAGGVGVAGAGVAADESLAAGAAGASSRLLHPASKAVNMTEANTA